MQDEVKCNKLKRMKTQFWKIVWSIAVLKSRNCWSNCIGYAIQIESVEEIDKVLMSLRTIKLYFLKN